MKGAVEECVWGWEMEGKTGRQHGFWLKNKHTYTHTHTQLFYYLSRVRTKIS